MDIAAIVGLGLVATVLAVLLRQYKPEYAMLVSIMAGVVILFVALAYLSPMLGELGKLLSRAGADAEMTGILLKALGICYITQIASDSCRDAGETAIAAKLELAGKLAVVALSLPLFLKLTDIVLMLLAV